MKKYLLIGTLLIVSLTGCSEFNDDRGKGDAPVLNKKGDDWPAVVVNFPDGFANIAFKCLNGNGLYVTTRDAAPVVVEEDPNCSGDKIIAFGE